MMLERLTGTGMRRHLKKKLREEMMQLKVQRSSMNG